MLRGGGPRSGGGVLYGSPPERVHHISFEYNGRVLRATSHLSWKLGIHRLYGGTAFIRPLRNRNQAIEMNEGPRRGIFYEPRVTRGDVVILSLLPRRDIWVRGGRWPIVIFDYSSSGPYGMFLRITNHEQQTAVFFCVIILLLYSVDNIILSWQNCNK